MNLLPGKAKTGFYHDKKQEAQAPKAALITTIIFGLIIVTAVVEFAKIGSVKQLQSYKIARNKNMTST